jgi:hypothetical protein
MITKPLLIALVAGLSICGSLVGIIHQMQVNEAKMILRYEQEIAALRVQLNDDREQRKAEEKRMAAAREKNLQDLANGMASLVAPANQ